MKPESEGTFRVHDSTRWDARLAVTTNGNNVIAHAGAATLRLTADRAGLTKALSDTLRRDDFTPDHDRGRVLVDAAVMMADGGNTLRAIDVLRHHGDLFGEVASPATLCRAFGEIDAACLEDLDAARAPGTTPGVGPHRRSPRPYPRGRGALRRPRRADRAAR